MKYQFIYLNAVTVWLNDYEWLKCLPGGLGSRHHPFGRRGIVLCPGQGWIYAEEAGKSKWLHLGEPCLKGLTWTYYMIWAMIWAMGVSINGGTPIAGWVGGTHIGNPHRWAQGDLHQIGVAVCICDLICNAYSHLQNKMLCHVCIQCTYM